MTKLFFTSAFVGLTTLCAHSQSSYTSVQIDKKMQPGLTLEVPSNTETSEGTLLQKLGETGYKPETTGTMFWKKNKHDGFYVFNGVQLPDLGSQKLDLYFKVDQKGKKQQNLSTMYMLVSKGYDNFVSPESDSATFVAASKFLNGFIANTASYSLQQEIEAQEKVVASAEKKLGNLQDEDKSIRKKIEQLNEDLKKNEAATQQQTQEIATQRTTLETLKQKVQQ